VVGKRLLVGKYALYQNKVQYVRNIEGSGQVDVVENITKSERKVDWRKLQTIE
jgi:hypothetical protein